MQARGRESSMLGDGTDNRLIPQEVIPQEAHSQEVIARNIIPQ